MKIIYVVLYVHMIIGYIQVKRLHCIYNENKIMFVSTKLTTITSPEIHRKILQLHIITRDVTRMYTLNWLLSSSISLTASIFAVMVMLPSSECICLSAIQSVSIGLPSSIDTQSKCDVAHTLFF